MAGFSDISSDLLARPSTRRRSYFVRLCYKKVPFVSWGHAGVHRVDASCTACDHWAKLDLVDLIRRGLGDVPLIHLPLRCAACGKTEHKAVVSGRAYPSQPIPPAMPP